MKQEMKDRFGSLPEEANSLIDLIEFKILGTQLHLKNISINSKRMIIRFHDEIIEGERELMQQRLVSIVDNASYPFTFVQGSGKGFGLKIQFSNNIENHTEFSKNFLQSLV